LEIYSNNPLLIRVSKEDNEVVNFGGGEAVLLRKLFQSAMGAQHAHDGMTIRAIQFCI
jgi:hypothetical protein